MALMNVDLKDLTSEIRKIGQHPVDAGNHADIWLGEYIDQKRNTGKVAIKVIRSAFTAEETRIFNEKLLREARLWATLNHENIVPFLGKMAGSDMSRHSAPALVAPYYKNGSLKKYVTTNKSITLRGKMDLMYGAANGLAFLHAHRIIHGDIKPGNILINDSGQAVLADFGLSLVLEMSGFTTKNTPGTLRYMAPELLAETTTSVATRPTAPTDVWAFGIAATEVFSQKQPYHNLSSDAAVLIYVTKNGRLKYDDYKSDMKESLWTLLSKCWEQNPASRPSMKDIKGFVDKKRGSYV